MNNRLLRITINLPFILAYLISCKNTGTQDLLDANFLAKGQAAIDLLSPTQDQQVTTANPILSWSARGVTLYTLQISTDSSFSNLVLSKDVNGTSYTVVNADLLGQSFLPTSTYFWRVKVAKLNDNLQSKTGSFFLVAMPTSGSGYAGALYVDGNSSNLTQIGSKQAPYRKIQAAISGADSLRNSSASIAIDILVAKGTYSESIVLAPGISIYGGYESTSWSKNISSNITTINTTADRTVSGFSDITLAYQTTTVVDGFVINGGAVSGILNYAIYLLSANPIVSNNTINGGSGTTSHAIYNSSSNPQIKSNTINGGTGSSSSYGIYNSNSSPTITNNSINGGVANGRGISVQSSSAPTIIGNTINGGSSGTTTGIDISNAASFLIYNNIIYGGSTAAGTSRSIAINVGSPTISNNTLIAGGSTTGSVYGLYLANASTPALTNNTFYTASGTTRFCIYELGSSADPTSLQNNLMLDCTTALYGDNVGAAGNCPSDTTANCYTTEAQINTAANTTQGIAASSQGNLGPSSVANFAAANFVSTSDFHLTAGSPLNIRCGGKDTSLSTCGSAGTSSCGSVSNDFDSILRTANLTGTCAGASNTGAAGYSIGAYEKD